MKTKGKRQDFDRAGRATADGRRAEPGVLKVGTANGASDELAPDDN
jgi:hypothetical protein